jgi:DNA-binding NtrC family response regulator
MEGKRKGYEMTRIIVVDDEALIADTLVLILHLSGYDARAFYDAETALRECAACDPEVLISDVIMPGMSGVELAVKIRERHPSCRVILFSGNAAVADLLEMARSRGYEFEVLLKPVPPEEILAIVANPRHVPRSWARVIATEARSL